jgi:hypothetical protein
MNGRWWEMGLEDLRREYAKLRSRHERVLTAITNLEEERDDLLYFPPNDEALNSCIERFVERVDRILEEGPKTESGGATKFYAYSWGSAPKEGP